MAKSEEVVTKFLCVNCKFTFTIGDYKGVDLSCPVCIEIKPLVLKKIKLHHYGCECGYWWTLSNKQYKQHKSINPVGTMSCPVCRKLVSI
jgi:hypothetical protein